MGLFGGFKAKFTKDSSKAKEKSAVVVLKYHSYSEFDTADHPAPPVNTVKKNGVVHDNQRNKQRPPIKSTIFDNTTNSKLNEIKKSLSLRNIASSSTPGPSKSQAQNETKSAVDSSTKTGTSSSSKESNLSKTLNSQRINKGQAPVKGQTSVSQIIDKDQAPVSQIIDKSQSNVEKEGHSTIGSSESAEQNIIFLKSQTSRTITLNDEHDNVDRSTLISMTQQQPEKKDDASVEEEIYGTREDFMDQNEFKVNVVQHDKDKVAFSEDEISYAEEEEPLNLWSRGFSNQAESIFFQGDMNPTINRPRRIFLQNDEDDDSEDGENEVEC